MTTITKAAFVADLAETHNMNRQSTQEVGRKRRCGHPDAIRPPGKASISRLNALISSKWPAISNGRSHSRNDT